MGMVWEGKDTPGLELLYFLRKSTKRWVVIDGDWLQEGSSTCTETNDTIVR
jgi:hypothetical protein